MGECTHGAACTADTEGGIYRAHWRRRLTCRWDNEEVEEKATWLRGVESACWADDTCIGAWQAPLACRPVFTYKEKV
eukprot:3886008-Pleurochrysis_carterae.AAC.1